MLLNLLFIYLLYYQYFPPTDLKFFSLPACVSLETKGKRMKAKSFRLGSMPSVEIRGQRKWKVSDDFIECRWSSPLRSFESLSAVGAGVLSDGARPAAPIPSANTAINFWKIYHESSRERVELSCEMESSYHPTTHNKMNNDDVWKRTNNSRWLRCQMNM
jgi:hypothetical protein